MPGPTTINNQTLEDAGNAAVPAGANEAVSDRNNQSLQPLQSAGLSFETGDADARVDAEYRQEDARFRTQAGESLSVYDSGNFAPHLRSISVQKPEIIAALDFKPVWRNGTVLTNAGKFINTQISARRIRISDLRNLFAELREDPESEVGKLTQGLVEELERELSIASQDVRTVEDIMSRAYELSSALNLKDNARGLQQNLQKIRRKRLDDFPVSTDLDADVSLRMMLEKNHSFSRREVDSFSNTKLLSYMSLDLSSLTTGPLITKNRLDELRTPNNGFPQGAFTFRTKNEDGQRLFLAPHLAINAPYVKGRCSPAQNEGFFERSPLASRQVFFQGFDEGTDPADHAAELALSLSVLCRDFAMSSALGNDDFMTNFMQLFTMEEGAESFNVAERLFGKNGLQDSDNVVSLSRTDLSTNFFDSLIRRVDGQFVPTFDPISSAYNPQELGSVERTFDSLYEAYVAPMVATIQDAEVDSENIQQLSQEVPRILRGLADSLEYMMALNNNSLQPMAIMNQILQFLNNLLDDFEVVREGGLQKLPWLQACLLNEAVQRRQEGGSLDISAYDGDANAQNPTYFIPMIELLTTLASAISKSTSATTSDSRFVDFISIVVDGDRANEGQRRPTSSEFNSLALSCGDAIIANLVDNIKRPYSTALSTGDSGDITETPVEGVAVPAAETYGTPRAVGEKFFGSDDSGLSRKILSLGDLERELEKRPTNEDIESLGLNRPAGTIMLPIEGNLGGSLSRAGLHIMDAPRNSESPNPFMLTRASSIHRFVNLIKDNRGTPNFASAAEGILQSLFAAALARGPVLQTMQNKSYAMISSATETSGILAALIGAIANVSSRFFPARFKPIAGYYSSYRLEENWGNSSPINMHLNGFDVTASFHRDVKQYLEGNNSIDAITEDYSNLKMFLTQFKSVVDHNYRMATDFVDFCRATAAEVENSTNNLREAFVQTSGQKREDPEFVRVLPNLRDMVDPSQVALSKKAIRDVLSAEGEEKYFDNFFVRESDENNFYSLLKDSKLMEGKGDNINMMYVGVPIGFTQKVLNIDPFDNPDAYANQRKVDVIIRKVDLQFGRRLIVGEKRHTFDLSTFFDKFENSVSADPETRNDRNIDPASEDPDFFKDIQERTLPESTDIFEKYSLLRKLSGLGTSSTPFKFSSTRGDATQEEIFRNTVIDHLMKTYTRLAYGVSIDENSFFVDPQVDLKKPSSDEIQKFTTLVNAQISKTLGQSITFDNLLVGSRANREVVSRLLRGERVEPVIEQVIADVEGTSSDASFLASEDIVNFSRMFSYNNPIAVPSSTRARAVSPKAFERVFCIPIDPDDFQITTPPQLRPIANRFTEISGLPATEFLEGTDDDVVYKHISRRDGLPQAYQYQVLIVPHGAQEDDQE